MTNPAQIDGGLQAALADAMAAPVLPGEMVAVPFEVAMLINMTYLPRRIDKMRSRSPEIVAAAETFRDIVARAAKSLYPEVAGVTHDAA